MYLIPLLILIALVLFFYWKNHSAQRKERGTIPNKLSQLLQNHVGYYQKLSAEEKLLFEQRIAAFLGEVRIEGIGLEVEELDRVLVAASAIIPIFGFKEWKYRNLTNVILYPDTFNGEFQYEGTDRNILGMVGNGYLNGQMILSQSSLRKGFSNQSDENNTAIHEFVHLLDKSDGAVDGLPENLLQHRYILPWLRMIRQEIQRIKEGESDINPYAATAESEFLAVVAEYFFERPALLEAKHPDLYRMLTMIFHQNPEQPPAKQ